MALTGKFWEALFWEVDGARLLDGWREWGMREAVIAWTPWKVPARIRRSFEPRVLRPG